ncbi:hypothetical protein B0O99DRAFT_670734 [Bisporella sp. PMI_857]|nr:hypothetical protein B0O99DRAFT_670734 [Bisporella sp. PMI_857]
MMFPIRSLKALLSLTIFFCLILYHLRGYGRAIFANDFHGQLKLDSSYTPSSDFDIVVSMYKEDLEKIRWAIGELKNAEYIKTLTPNVIIYVKDQDANMDMIQNVTGANVVRRIPNTGREGGTFLHHIVHEWDNLAKQTLFTQAYAHRLKKETLPKLTNYLGPDTGMLNLGYATVCDCHTCIDRYEWNDPWKIVAAKYEEIHKRTCDKVLLSYKGQFIASARRIRGIRKAIYEELLEGVTTSIAWAHDKNIIGKEQDSLNAPFLGYTLERLWYILMQCGDAKKAEMCPSMLTSRGIAGKREDCQCLDQII